MHRLLTMNKFAPCACSSIPLGDSFRSCRSDACSEHRAGALHLERRFQRRLERRAGQPRASVAIPCIPEVLVRTHSHGARTVSRTNARRVLARKTPPNASCNIVLAGARDLPLGQFSVDSDACIGRSRGILADLGPHWPALTRVRPDEARLWRKVWWETLPVSSPMWGNIGQSCSKLADRCAGLARQFLAGRVASRAPRGHALASCGACFRVSLGSMKAMRMGRL